MSDAKKNLLLFFDRPTEPCFMQKGENKSIFQLPDNYYPEKYRSTSNTIADRFGSDATQTIPIRNISLPNLSLPMQLPYNSQFSLWVPKHKEMATKLIDIFIGMRDVEDLQSLCSYCQLRINPYLFNYCLSVAILHREDTKGLNIPTFAETFPDKFMDPKVFRKAREVSTVVPSGNRMPVVIPQNYTASEWDQEQRVAYFREDIGINLHHWHWHLVYPFDSADRTIVAKDRRGELFYYMHQQIVARYTTERFCNKLGAPRRFSNFREPIEEGYFPKLDSQVASRAWPPRFAGSTIRDIDRPVDQIRVDVAQLETWRDRFLDAIDKMSVMLKNGRRVPLDEETGIDMLGNMMESSILSPNRDFYGDLHNMGHVFISYSHDPDHRNLEQFGVMGDSATAMRDPVFYRWHAYVDDLFQLYKNKLPPYTTDKLDFPGVRVASVSVESSGGPNVFRTQWEQSTVELGRGLDFTPRGSVLARFTHLTHDDFTYVIEVNNTSGAALMGTVRLFLAPAADGAGAPLAFADQRRLMIELDKFTQALPAGSSTVRRRSAQSSVTIPYERTFRRQAARPGEPGAAPAADFDFCGCGWPHHMLLPKGAPDGFPVVLFAMVSNWAEDRVEQDTAGTCTDAASYCGLRDRRYPDRRAMGFPFDRPAPAASLADFLTPNMSVRDCSIRFSDAVRQRQQGSVTSNAGASQTSNNQASNIPPFANFTHSGNLTQNTNLTQTGSLITQNEDSIQNVSSQNGLTDITHVLASSVFSQTNNDCNRNNDKLPNSKECGCKETYTAEEIDALIRKPYYYIKCNHKQHIF
ncbi:phenoloxidase subunit 1-like isoform X2 [Zerene cesonia]|uniref:phenoloxidase subunit 1-like isoform X2 n=1 Tax=Zerene cesonia TaxID=33412 RepID=UPI0018E50AF5|nr:phenoloxidase subunit 1-like isoform X2 [Zerene cesonia]